MGAGAIHHPFESGGRPHGNVAGPRGGAEERESATGGRVSGGRERSGGELMAGGRVERNQG